MSPEDLPPPYLCDHFSRANIADWEMPCSLRSALLMDTHLLLLGTSAASRASHMSTSSRGKPDSKENIGGLRAKACASANMERLCTADENPLPPCESRDTQFNLP